MSSMLGTRNTYFSIAFKDKPRHLYAFVTNCLYHTLIVYRPLGQKGLRGQCYHPSTIESHKQHHQRTHGSLTVPSFLLCCCDIKISLWFLQQYYCLSAYPQRPNHFLHLCHKPQHDYSQRIYPHQSFLTENDSQMFTSLSHLF